MAGLGRRDFLLAAGAIPMFGQAPGTVQSDRPTAPHGAMVGDVVPGRAILWSRSDRPARMAVRWRTSPSASWQQLPGPHCLDITDYTGRVELTGLPAGQTIEYEVSFLSLSSPRSTSDAV